MKPTISDYRRELANSQQWISKLISDIDGRKDDEHGTYRSLASRANRQWERNRALLEEGE